MDRPIVPLRYETMLHLFEPSQEHLLGTVARLAVFQILRYTLEQFPCQVQFQGSVAGHLFWNIMREICRSYLC